MNKIKYYYFNNNIVRIKKNKVQFFYYFITLKSIIIKNVLFSSKNYPYIFLEAIFI